MALQSTENLTVKDVDKLLQLFLQLKKGCETKIPSKDKELWKKCIEKAKNDVFKERREDLFRQSSHARESELSSEDENKLWQDCGKIAKKEVFANEQIEKQVKTDAAKGSVPSNSQEKQIPQRTIWRRSFNSRIFLWAESYYCRDDSAYNRAVLKAENKIAQIIKRIDRRLYPVQDILRTFSRAKDTLLDKDWREITAFFFVDNTMQFRPGQKKLLKVTIDALEAIKRKVEQQKPRVSQRIAALLWKLYETTLKAFFESIFEGRYPK